MTAFENGHAYRTAIPLDPPAGRSVPTIEVEMSGASGFFEPVQGKVDTGAFMTMLTFATADALGLDDPTVGFLRQGTAEAANGQPIPYYVHRILISVPNAQGGDLQLVLEAGFAKEVSRNLFGVDWLSSACVAIDRQRVHLLRD
jgi:hypothetical protein